MNFGMQHKTGDEDEDREISVHRALSVIRLYAAETGLDPRVDDDQRAAIVDLLTDLRLFVADAGNNLEWDVLLATANHHFEEEREKDPNEFRR